MRLIDADELKKMFPDNGEGSWAYNATAKAYIDAQPTAYDPEAVVKELEKASFDNTDWGYSAHPELRSYYVMRTKDAIEIVRGGRNEV